MTRERYEWQQHRVSTDRLIEVTARINDFVDEPVSPLVEEFARVLGSPWAAMREANGTAWEATPGEMTMNSQNFLQLIHSKGREHTQLLRYVPPNLLDITDDQLAELHHAVPVIMRASYPPDFAKAFEHDWNSMLVHCGYKEDLPDRTVAEIPPVEATITTASEAKQHIIDNARQYVLSLDWSWAFDYEVAEADIKRWFDYSYPHILAKNAVTPVLTVYDVIRDAEVVEQLPEHHRLILDEQYMLALLMDHISPEDATFLRDCLCLYVADDIAERFGSDAAGKLLMTSPGMLQAVERQMRYFYMDEGQGTPD